MQANNAELLVAKSPVYMRNNQVERKIIWAKISLITGMHEKIREKRNVI